MAVMKVLDQLKKEFGDDILSLVKFATEPENKIEISADEKKGSWKKRKQHTVNICQKGSREELLVVLADNYQRKKKSSAI